MDVTYDLFRRLMYHWQQSVDARETGNGHDGRQTAAEQHARRLIAQCGRSWPTAYLVLDDD